MAINRFFLALICLNLMFLGCKTKQQTGSGSACDTKGTFVDRTGLDGCTFLIKLEDGRLLLPIYDANPDFQPKDGLKVRLAFTAEEDYVSICMAENLAGKITCLELDD